MERDFDGVIAARLTVSPRTSTATTVQVPMLFG